MIRQQADTLREAQRRIEQLEHQAEQPLRRQYGTRSDRLGQYQLRLIEDDAAEGDAGLRPTEAVPEARGPPARTWRRQRDPFAYLRDVLDRLPTHPADRLGELLTDSWFVDHPNVRRKVAS